MKTTFDDMCAILYDFQSRYNQDTREPIVDYFRTQDLGLPLAIAYHEDWIVDLRDEGRTWVEHSFQSFLELFELEDIGWTDLFVIEAKIGLEPEED